MSLLMDRGLPLMRSASCSVSSASRRGKGSRSLGGGQRESLSPPDGQDQVGINEWAIGSANRVRA